MAKAARDPPCKHLAADADVIRRAAERVAWQERVRVLRTSSARAPGEMHRYFEACCAPSSARPSVRCLPTTRVGSRRILRCVRRSSRASQQVCSPSGGYLRCAQVLVDYTALGDASPAVPGTLRSLKRSSVLSHDRPGELRSITMRGCSNGWDIPWRLCRNRRVTRHGLPARGAVVAGHPARGAATAGS
jgi:hypothetical protein